jgi:hypothetical protein|tara:strand:- start:1621 stop:2505 length:885 start_codon:yes stop_codon:yes gene_type:complete
MAETFSLQVDGKAVEFLVQSPTLHQQREGQKVYNQAFSDAVKSGSIVRAKLDDLLKDQGLWDDNKQARFMAIQTELNDCEKQLATGGISLQNAKGVALKMKNLREELKDLISVRTNLDTHTAEGQADNARFNYLVSCCLVYSSNKKVYFSSYEDYLNRSSDPIGVMGAQKLAAMLYGLDSEFEKKLPENKFLINYKFVNDDLRFVNPAGQLVDEDGRRVDENGRYVNEAGKFVDRDGTLVSADGDYVVDFVPFTDDSGKPVVLENENENKTEESTDQPEVSTKEDKEPETQPVE